MTCQHRQPGKPPLWIKHAWSTLPLAVRWMACWPVLVAAYLVTFQLSAIIADLMLLTVLTLPSRMAAAASPILADAMHMSIMLPAIRRLVPSRQHVVILGSALIVALVTMIAGHRLATDLLAGNSPWPPQFYPPSTGSLEDWPWRSARDFLNCLVVLIMVGVYGLRLWRQTSMAAAHEKTPG